MKTELIAIPIIAIATGLTVERILAQTFADKSFDFKNFICSFVISLLWLSKDIIVKYL